MSVSRAEVKKGLISVMDMLGKGYRVVFDRDASSGVDCSQATHKLTGEVLKFTFKNKAWELRLQAIPWNGIQTEMEAAGANVRQISAVLDPQGQVDGP
eukprot:6490284-Amphidinium_carterae.2